MSLNPHSVTKALEAAVSDYTDAPYAVAVNSCSMALLLAVAWRLRHDAPMTASMVSALQQPGGPHIEIPKRTYVSVAQSILLAGGRTAFRDEEWSGAYELKPLRIFDSARWFTSGLYKKVTRSRGGFVCTSHHCSKTLGDSQAGMILHDSPEADIWLRKARFDGRTEGVAPKDDRFDMVGWHAYLSPDVAARLLWKLSVLPENNAPLPNDEYPDLSQHPIFQRSHTYT